MPEQHLLPKSFVLRTLGEPRSPVDDSCAAHRSDLSPVRRPPSEVLSSPDCSPAFMECPYRISLTCLPASGTGSSRRPEGVAYRGRTWRLPPIMDRNT